LRGFSGPTTTRGKSEKVRIRQVLNLNLARKVSTYS
jgi:hypothetical protein